MGFPTNRFVKAVDPNLICGICACVLDTPTLTPCGHTFCRSCIHIWLDTASVSSCPECRSKMEKDSVRPILSLRNLIFSLEVTCPNKSRGCPEVMRMDSQDAHQSECLHATVCVKCNRHIDTPHLSEHQMDCRDFHSSEVQGETVCAGNHLTSSLEQSRKDANDNTSKAVLSCPRMSGFSREDNGSTYSTYLLQRISALEKQVSRLLDDLHEAHSKNSVLYFQNRHMRENERHRREHSTSNPLSGPSNDFIVTSQQDVARLSLYIARYLLQKPPSVDRDKVFRSIRQCYEMQFCLTTNDSKIEHDIHMLLATAYSSNWFTGAQRILLGCWLQCVLKKQG